MIKALVLAAVAAVTVVGCKSPPSEVACQLAGTSLSCSVDGITVAAIVPADVATAIGIAAPFSNGAVTAQSGSRIGESLPVGCTLDLKPHLATCTNSVTGIRSRPFAFPG